MAKELPQITGAAGKDGKLTAERQRWVLDTFKKWGVDLEEFLLSTHASTCLTAAAVVDNRIAEALRLKMVNLNADLRKKLFKPYGPLASFSARIDIAYALGLLSKDIAKEAHTIRGIRNDFAHATKRMNCESPGIKEECEQLSTYTRGKNLLHVYVEAVEKILKHLNAEVVRYQTAQALTPTDEKKNRERTKQQPIRNDDSE
jgi:DNA-binding MltR family transcriptional regulator